MVGDEIEFTLPVGFMDRFGMFHRNGKMRLSKVSDELLYLKDDRVKENRYYLGVLLLSEVITQLGNITDIKPELLEQMYSKDLEYLQELYLEINSN